MVANSQGINSESRNCVVLPPDALLVDLDVDSATFIGKIEPDNVLSYRATREKYKKRLLTAYGPAYLPDHNVPSTLKFSYPGGKMSPSCNIEMDVWQPSFLGEAIRTPSWFDASAIVGALERIIADKVSHRRVPTNADLLTCPLYPSQSKKPSWVNRIMSSSSKRNAPTPGELMANQALRVRALHYIGTRDALESKFSHLQRRLLRMVQEGEMVRGVPAVQDCPPPS
jgi:hypothetical protein